MATVHVALPPGVYNVRTSESPPRGVVNPTANNSSLFVTTASNTAANQQWLISGNGITVAMDAGTYAFSTTSPSAVNTAISRSATASVPWIVNVVWDTSRTVYTGTIMTNDISKNYWGLNGNNVQLQDTPYTWSFVPV